MPRLTHLGVTPELTPNFTKRIVLTNLLGLLFGINMSASALAFLYFGQTRLALFTFFFVLTELGWLVFNHFRCYDIARVGMLVTSNVLGLAVSLLLPDTGYNRGFYVMAGLPILLFELREKAYVVLGLLLPLVLYPLSEWGQYHMPISLSLAPGTIEFIRYAIGVVYVLLIFLMFLFLSKENARAETQLEVQRARAFSSAKFASLGEMASGIAHEVNNPMMVIALNNEQLKKLLSRSELDRERAMQKLGLIERGVRRVAKIVEAMQMFSRDGTGRPLEPVSLATIIDDTLVFCAERFINYKIRFELVVPREQEVRVNCRPMQISQIILNLLNNAFDAVEESAEKRITLEVLEDRGRGTVAIKVTDTGRGVRESEREKIFQPFYTTKPVGRGTGLGLSLSRKLAHDHSGELFLDLARAETCLVLELPCAKAV